MPKPPFIHHVRLHNYKSIGHCDVQLGPLTILVGPNGSGKSNFLDAFAFTRTTLVAGLTPALETRGGIDAVNHRAASHSPGFTIELHFNLTDIAQSGRYSFEVATQDDRRSYIRRESCEISSDDESVEPTSCVVQDGIIATSNITAALRPPRSDRLYLSDANIPEFRPVLDALTNMAFYNPHPAAMRQINRGNYEHRLERDGRNIADVLVSLPNQNHNRLKRVQQYLSQLVPETDSLAQSTISDLDALRHHSHATGFRQAVWQAAARNLSDGTLRALAVLTALLQNTDAPPSLVAVEAPEAGWYPANIELLWDAMDDAQDSSQMMITTHSADLLDRSDLDPVSLVATAMTRGKTQIGPVVATSRQLLDDRLATPGELLRQGRLSPIPVNAPSPTDHVD